MTAILNCDYKTTIDDGNVFGLCVRWGFPALKPIDSTNFNFSTNDYR